MIKYIINQSNIFRAYGSNKMISPYGISGINRFYSSNISPYGTKNSDINNNIRSKKRLVINSKNFKGLNIKNLSCVELEKKNVEAGINATNFIFNTEKIKSNSLGTQTSVVPTIIQDLRSIYKLNRVKYNNRRGKFNHPQRGINIINNRKEYNQDLTLLLNSYKFSLLDTKIKENQQLDFLWQSKIFIKLLQQHPILLDHTINCLLTLKKDSLVDYLTRVWVGYFDYINQYDDKYNLDKWQGIKIELSGRVGYKKMGRAKKYSSFWGSLKNASARLPLQYSYSQLNTRYGVIGVKVFIR